MHCVTLSTSPHAMYRQGCGCQHYSPCFSVLFLLPFSVLLLLTRGGWSIICVWALRGVDIMAKAIRRKAGRPRGHAKYTEVLRVKVTPAQKLQLLRAADSADLSLSEYCRDRLARQEAKR